MSMRSWLAVLALLALCLVSVVARAEPLDAHAVGGGGLVELTPHASDFAGKLVVENRGNAPVRVELSLRDGTSENPRLPPGLHVSFSGGASSARLAPGEKREAEVTWSPLKGRRVHEIYGHVLVQGEAEGERARAVGFHAALAGSESGAVGHTLSLSILIPLFGGMLLFLLRGREPRPGMLRAIVVGTAALQLGVLAWATSRFDHTLTRLTGGEGLQLLERAPLLPKLGIEWIVAVDGLSLVLALLVPVLVAVAALSAPHSSDLGRGGGFLLLLSAALGGAFVSFDLAVLAGFWLAAVVCASGLVWSTADDPRVARAIALPLGVAALLVGFAIWQLSHDAIPSYLLDGAPAPRVFSLTELAHGFLAQSPTSFGVTSVKLIYVALFLGAAITLGAPPFSSWLVTVLGRVPASSGILIGGGLTMLGGYGLVRIGYAGLPGGSGWAAPAVGVIGVVGALYAALQAAGSDDLPRFSARVLAAQAGFCLLGIASLTGVGVQGVLLALVSRAMFVALALALVAVLGTGRPALFAARAKAEPVYALLAQLAFLMAAGGPGTLGFVALLAALAGAMPTLPWLALLGLVPALALGAASLVVYVKAFHGSGEVVAPARELRDRDTSVLLALAVLTIAL